MAYIPAPDIKWELQQAHPEDVANWLASSEGQFKQAVAALLNDMIPPIPPTIKDCTIYCTGWKYSPTNDGFACQIVAQLGVIREGRRHWVAHCGHETFKQDWPVAHHEKASPSIQEYNPYTGTPFEPHLLTIREIIENPSLGRTTVAQALDMLAYRLPQKVQNKFGVPLS